MAAAADDRLEPDFHRIRLIAFGPDLRQSGNARLAFGSLQPRRCTFIDMDRVTVSAEFIQEALAGCLEHTPNLVLYNASDEHKKILDKIITGRHWDGKVLVL